MLLCSWAFRLLEASSSQTAFEDYSELLLKALNLFHGAPMATPSFWVDLHWLLS